MHKGFGASYKSHPEDTGVPCVTLGWFVPASPSVWAFPLGVLRSLLGDPIGVPTPPPALRGELQAQGGVIELV